MPSARVTRLRIQRHLMMWSWLYAAMTCGVATSAPPKPVASSPVITDSTPGHSAKLEAVIKGAKNLYLVASDGGNGFGFDWADWAEPKLIGPKGELKLTELKWKSATADWGQAQVNRNADGGELRINGKAVSFGIGTHANSVIHFELPDGYEKFVATVGIDNGGSDQGGGSSVQFLVYTETPGPIGQNAPVDRTPENAVAGLDVTDGVELQLFAAEPMLLSPSNIDIDHLGRVWVCEVVNYRRFANGNNPERTEGDRILILEDTNGDGMADKETVFYQGRDIDSAHGVCVLGNRVIVSAGDSVFSFYDDNGDSKADRKEVLFTGIKGTQHDHGFTVLRSAPTVDCTSTSATAVKNCTIQMVRSSSTLLAMKCELLASRIRKAWPSAANWMAAKSILWAGTSATTGNCASTASARSGSPTTMTTATKAFASTT